MTEPHSTARRVTTGIDARGKAVVVRDETIARDKGAMILWQADTPPVVGQSEPVAVQGWWPPPGGVRISLSTRAPDKAPPAQKAEQAWPDINDAAGFHASQSVDVILVVSGTIWLELDEGVEVALHAGDSLIQNGTRHRWRNHGDDWPLLAVFIIGAAPAA